MDIHEVEDTICAIATPVGEGGIGIVRISGPGALPAALRIFGPSSAASSPPPSHRLVHGWIRDPGSGAPLDEVLLVHMAAPRSYTREDVVEIHCHSGYAVLNAVLELVLGAGARLAEPGEFTRRAFLNGRLDLSQAEAVVDLIHSTSRRSLEAAGRHLQGRLRLQAEEWRREIVDLQARLEASMDFAEELDEDEGDWEAARRILRDGLVASLGAVLDRFEDGRILRRGFSLVLAGKPNVGKSSLLNALLRKDRAIVTPFPGTTRDVIEESFLLSGVAVRILDTAGVREDPDVVESAGIEKTFQSIREADGVLWLLDRSAPLDGRDDLIRRAIGSKPVVIVLNKADLAPVFGEEDVGRRYGIPCSPLTLSVLDPAHVDRLRGALAEAFLEKPLERGEEAIIPNLRQKGCLEKAKAALERAEALMEEGAYPELIALETEEARVQLDLLLGREVGEDLLDHVFSRFCIGK